MGRGEHGRPKGGGGQSTMFQSFQNLSKPFIGAGILALPRAFLEGGMVASTFMLVTLAFVAAYCIRQLVACSDRIMEGQRPQSEDHAPVAFDEPDPSRPGGYTPAATLPNVAADEKPLPSYSDIGFFAYGRLGTWACNFAMVSSQLGFCIAYTAFISQNLDVLEDSFTREHWLLVLFIAWSITAQLRDIRYLSFTSAIGNVVYLTSIAIIFYDGFNSHCCAATSDINMWRWTGLPFVFGTCSFALEGIALVLPVKADMARPHMFSQLLTMVMCAVTSAYLIFATVGYSFFGSQVHSVITKNLAEGLITDMLRISLSISLFFTYIIQLFPVSELVDQTFWPSLLPSSPRPTPEDGLLDGHRSSDDPTITVIPSSNSQRVKRIVLQSILRVGLVGFTALVAFIFKDFGLIISLVGALSNSLLAFILPSLFYIKIMRPQDPQVAVAVETTHVMYQYPYTVVCGCLYQK